MASDLQVRGEIFRVKHANLSVPESAIGFRAGVARRAAVPEPSLWEQTRKTTEGSPEGVAPFAGKQMPSNSRRQRR